MSFEKVLEAVHPEDRARAKEAAFYTLRTKRVEFRMPIRMGPSGGSNRGASRGSFLDGG